MNRELIPLYAFRRFTDVSPDFLREQGIKFLMLDLDSTIAKYCEKTPSDAVKQWVAAMESNRVTLFIVSNSRRAGRVETFAKPLGIGFIKEARKPSPAGVLRALEETGFNKGESALLGDQVFTDTLAANRAGVISIIVRPLNMKNPLLALRFAIESPFRAACVFKDRDRTSVSFGLRE